RSLGCARERLRSLSSSMAPMAETDVFKHSTPLLYDRYMGPLLFGPYAKHVAERVRPLRPKEILETAAGTGIVTRAVSEAVPDATITATDINPVVVEFAAERLRSEQVMFERADAQDLAYEDAKFDLVLCLFGIMFFPDKVRANEEAHRVLRPGGHYILVSFDRLDLNPVPKAAGEAVASLFADDPRYMERGPFSYADGAQIESDLRVAGFQGVEVETIALSSRVNARDAAHGIVLGSPFRGGSDGLGPPGLEGGRLRAGGALRPWARGGAPVLGPRPPRTQGARGAP